MGDDFALLGIDAEGAKRAAGARPVVHSKADEVDGDDFELWPEHQAAWEVFVDCQRQWRLIAIPVFGGAGGFLVQGLEATAVESSLRMLGVPRSQWRLTRAQLRVLESEAVEILNSNTKGTDV